MLPHVSLLKEKYLSTAMSIHLYTSQLHFYLVKLVCCCLFCLFVLFGGGGGGWGVCVSFCVGVFSFVLHFVCCRCCCLWGVFVLFLLLLLFFIYFFIFLVSVALITN